MYKAVFIDKDGTLIPDIPYNVDPTRVTLSPGVGQALFRLRAAGYLLIVISNQAGIARGLFGEMEVLGVLQRINELLEPYRVGLDAFYFCPHHPDGSVPEYARECDCRKPKPGMLLGAAKHLNIDLRRSWMIGDITTDSEAGKRAGCRTILIEKPYDPLIHLNADNRPDHVVHGWGEITPLILEGASWNISYGSFPGRR